MIRLARSGLGLVVIGLGILIAATGCTARAPASSGAGSAAPQRIEISYSNGEVRGGVTRVPVVLGSSVALIVSSDVADEVHLHGYDRRVDVPAGGTVTLDFVADQAGVFEAELEFKGVQLVQLAVR